MGQKSICGNSCDTCLRREEINCPGCRLGPGKYIYRECDIAQCCGAKNILSCEQCYKHEECQLLEERAQHQATRAPSRGYAESLKPPVNGEESRRIARWLKVMFICSLVSMILSPLSSLGQTLTKLNNESLSLAGYGIVLLLSPAMTALGVLSIVAICSLWKYAPSLKKELYWSIAMMAAAVVMAIAAVALLIMSQALFFRLSVGTMIPMLFLLVSAIFVLVAAIMTSRSHFYGLSELFEKADIDLSDRILSLWNWHIWTFVFIPAVVIVTAVLILAADWWAILIGILPLMVWGIYLNVRYYHILWRGIRAFENLAAQEDSFLGA